MSLLILFTFSFAFVVASFHFCDISTPILSIFSFTFSDTIPKSSITDLTLPSTVFLAPVIPSFTNEIPLPAKSIRDVPASTTKFADVLTITPDIFTIFPGNSFPISDIFPPIFSIKDFVLSLIVFTAPVALFAISPAISGILVTKDFIFSPVDFTAPVILSQTLGT